MFEETNKGFTVKNCGMAEFNGKYFVDTSKVGWTGKHCYRKKGVGNASNGHVVHHDGTFKDEVHRGIFIL